MTGGWGCRHARTATNESSNNSSNDRNGEDDDKIEVVIGLTWVAHPRTFRDTTQNKGTSTLPKPLPLGNVVQCPQLTLIAAAGGGSKPKFLRRGFQVGPESVGSEPGPACYRKGGQLAVTDANVVLGRVLPEYFPKIFGPDENGALSIVSGIGSKI